MSTQPVAINHIELRPNRDGQLRAYIVGTRVRVQDIACDSEKEGMTPDEIVGGLPHLTLGQVHAALSYYYDHLDEVRESMRADEEFARRMEEEQKRAHEAANKDVRSASLSS